MTTPCRHCHTTVRHTDTVGCCSGCGCAFSGLTAFDAHQSRGDDGRTLCTDPATALDRKGRQRYQESAKGRPGEPPVWALRSDGNPWAASA